MWGRAGHETLKQGSLDACWSNNTRASPADSSLSSTVPLQLRPSKGSVGVGGIGWKTEGWICWKMPHHTFGTEDHLKVSTLCSAGHRTRSLSKALLVTCAE